MTRWSENWIWSFSLFFCFVQISLNRIRVSIRRVQGQVSIVLYQIPNAQIFVDHYQYYGIVMRSTGMESEPFRLHANEIRAGANGGRWDSSKWDELSIERSRIQKWDDKSVGVDTSVIHKFYAVWRFGDKCTTNTLWLNRGNAWHRNVET